MEHRHDQRVSEYRMDQRYLQKEGAFREEAAKLWTDEASARERIRSNVTLAPEERQDLYKESNEGLERRLDRLVDEFSRDVSKDVSEAEQTLNRGTGPRFSDHLTAVTGVRDEKLAEIMGVARRSGQADLERAIAVTAYERGVRPVWSSWAEANPERAEAVKLLRGVPGPTSSTRGPPVRCARARRGRRTSCPRPQTNRGQPPRRPHASVRARSSSVSRSRGARSALGSSRGEGAVADA